MGLMKWLSDLGTPRYEPPETFGVPVPEKQEIDWESILVKAKKQAKIDADKDYTAYCEGLEELKDKFDLSINKNGKNLLVFAWEFNRIVIPASQITNLRLYRGNPVSIEDIHYQVDKDGKIFNLPTWFSVSSSRHYEHIKAPAAIPSTVDEIYVTGELTLKIPYGLGEKYFDRIAYLLNGSF